MSTIKEQAPLKKIHVLTRADLDDLDLTQYTNQLFGTVDENDSGSGGTGTGEDGFSPLIDVTQLTNGDVVLTVTDKEGTETVTIPAGTNGDNGQDGGYYTPSVNDGWLEWSASKSGMPSVMPANIRGPQGIQGEQGPKGDTGTGFSISKTYSSVSAMNAGYATDGVPLYGFVLIDTGNVNDVDNAKLYVKGDRSYEYLTDLSGSQGIKGETGAKGDDGYTPVKGVDYWTVADKSSIVTDVLNALEASEEVAV